MQDNIKDKVVVITGASSGFGAETARHLVNAGAKAVLGARREPRLQELANELGPDNCAILRTDVTDRAQVQALVEHGVKTFGRIDVMLNNAGIMPLSSASMLRVEDWDSVIDVNIKGVLYGIAAALPYFQAQQSGHFINVASVAGHVVDRNSWVYAATKSAVRFLSDGLRKDVKAWNIRTTIISPGAVDTELTASIKAETVARGMQQFYQDHAIDASSFARCVLFAMAQPDDVDINEILYRPTQQVV